MNLIEISKIIIILLISFLSSYLITIFNIPEALKIGKIYKFLDFPDSRKKHKKPLVRIGGASIAFGFLAISIIFIFINFRYSFNTNMGNFSLLGFIFCISLFFLLGLYEDIFSVKPITRLLLQLSLSLIICLNGLRIDHIDLSFLPLNISYINFPYILSIIITCIWITGIINAINWFDGLDGLAAGISSIIGLALLILCLFNKEYLLSILLSSFIGASIGFLKYNTYPAKILMGDCGSYLLGSTLSIFSLIGVKGYSDINLGSINLEIPLLLMSILIIDMGYVIFIRLMNGNSPFYPDRNHLHHRLLNLGLKESEVVRLINLIFIFSSSITIIFASNRVHNYF